ncbi:acyl-CoA thioesterase [Marinagarivorans algicola]|uniref:acyl-CoA thioesterase n=1 Tax=Marinagarivorans algicola TaxID=1513270 RepID=UPI0006B64756|nr:acyl-CoA thioesterase [Marinagarivorans algicola]
MEYLFKQHFKVRDYECDLQGIVNNSVYQNYLEHARHEFLLSKGIHFAELARQGVNLVVIRAELDYKASLRSGDCFWVGVNHTPKSALRGIFSQSIYSDNGAGNTTLILNSLFTWAAISPEGKPLKAQHIIDKLHYDPAATKTPAQPTKG